MWTFLETIALLILNRKGGELDMAAIYVALIIKGKKNFSDVPARLQDQVREMLIDLDLEYLIDAE